MAAPLVYIFHKEIFKISYINHHYSLVVFYFQHYCIDITRVSKSNILLFKRERKFYQAILNEFSFKKVFI